jgi:hypothetical protein
MNREQWLAFAKEHRQEIISLMADYHPRNRRVKGIPAGAQDDIVGAAEEACQNVRKRILEDASKIENLEPATVLFSRALDSDNVDVIMGLLWDTWFGVPESQSFAWSLVGFKEIVALMDGIEGEHNDGDGNSGTITSKGNS